MESNLRTRAGTFQRKLATRQLASNFDRQYAPVPSARFQARAWVVNFLQYLLLGCNLGPPPMAKGLQTNETDAITDAITRE